MQAVLERDSELTRIGAALTRAEGGDGDVLVVEGPAGIGKSLLLDHARHAARECGAAALRAGGGELERAYPFGVMRQLLERELLGSAGERRVALLDGAGPAVAAVGLVPGPADPSFAVVHGLFRLVANLARERALLIAVDDVQWADAPSLRALEYLCARVGDLPVAVVLAVRTGASGGDLDALLVRAADTLRPAPLGERAVARLLADRTTDKGVVAAAWRATGGNPYLVAGLASELAGAGAVAPDAVEGLGARAVARPLALRVARLPSPCRALARAVAVLGAHAELPHAAALARLDDGEDAAAALAAAGILDGARPLGFVHPVVRRCVLDDMTAGERAALNAHAAARLRDAGLRAAALAPYLLATEPAADAAVVGQLRAAAADALRGGAPALAARHLARALREPPPAPELAAVLAELGDAEWLAGAVAEAVEHLEAALERTTEPRLRAERSLALYRAQFAMGRFLDAFALLERETARLAGAAEPGQLVRMETGLASIGLLHPATVGRLQRAQARDTPAELLRIACWTCATSTAAETIAAAERALTGARAQTAGPADSLAVCEMLWLLAYADAHDLALSVLDDNLADARARSSTFGMSTAHALRALIALQRGEVVAAEAEARAGAGLPGLSRFVRPLLFGTLAQALVARGALAEAEAAIEESGCGPDLPEFVCLNPVFHARGVLRLAQGRCEAALGDFSEFGDRSRRIGLRNPGDPWRLGAAEALVRLGCPDEAAALAAEHLELARRWGTASAVGVALHGRALSLGADPAGLALAAEALAGSSAQLAHARCLVDLGAALRRANRRADARGPLREGLELARRCGARALAERAHEELLVAGARPRRLMFSGPEALTPSERRVAELAAGGASNRDIADALFVTTKTVDNHLGRVYTKLGISSRAALAAVLGEPIAELP